jgi:hypothetical protein
VCLELQQTWMQSGVGKDAVGGYIQTLSVLLCVLLLLLLFCFVGLVCLELQQTWMKSGQPVGSCVPM